MFFQKIGLICLLQYIWSLPKMGAKYAKDSHMHSMTFIFELNHMLESLFPRRSISLSKLIFITLFMAEKCNPDSSE